MTQRQQPAVPVELADGGTATLRPLRHGEVAPVLEVFAGMSELSRSRRFLTGMARLPAMMLTALTDVDGCDRVAWVASVDGCARALSREAGARSSVRPVDVPAVRPTGSPASASSEASAIVEVASRWLRCEER